MGGGAPTGGGASGDCPAVDAGGINIGGGPAAGDVMLDGGGGWGVGRTGAAEPGGGARGVVIWGGNGAEPGF